MKLTDKRFRIWITIIASMPVMMSAFALILIDIDSISDLFYHRYLELFIVWETTYWLGGLLTFRRINRYGWKKGAFISWGVTGAFLVIGSFLWAGIRISDGFSGLAYFMISCISWCFSILPLLYGLYLFHKNINSDY